MVDEEQVKGLFLRLAEATAPKSSPHARQTITQRIEELCDRRRMSLYSESDGREASIVMPSFPDPVTYGRLDSVQRERLTVLVEEFRRNSVFGGRVRMTCTDGRTTSVSFRDAIVLFLSSLAKGEVTELTSSASESDSDEGVVFEPITAAIARFLKETTGDQENDEESWINDRCQVKGLSIDDVLERFVFTSDVHEQPIVYNRPLRLWDFIAKKGGGSFDTGALQLDEDESWNQRKLEIAEFEKEPTSNPLLAGFPGMANGVCHVTADDDVVETRTKQRHGQSCTIPVTTNKESFEKELMPTVLLALDGILPAIQSLETASTLRKATALTKLMTKITKAGRVRFALDKFVSLPPSRDAVQNTFVAAMCSILRFHSAALQSLPESIRKRQQSDNVDRRTQQGETSISLIEAVLHTEGIQKQLKALSAVCGMDHGTENNPEEAMKKLPSGIHLLSHLYAELLEADNQMGPMIRYLFCCCFQPFHSQMRKWLYTTEDVFQRSAISGKRIPLPDFLKSVEAPFHEAGQQLRILNSLKTGLRTEEAVVQSIRRIAETESFEMTKICKELDDEWAMSETGFNEIGLARWMAASDTERVVIPFKHNVLHEVVDLLCRSVTERSEEVQHILRTARDIRRVEKEVADAKKLETFLSRMGQIERERKASLQRVSEQRKQMHVLLTEQKIAVSEQRARRAAERAHEIRQEQELIKQKALKEHNEAIEQLEQEIMLTYSGRKAMEVEVVAMDVDQGNTVEDATEHDESQMVIDSGSDTAGPSATVRPERQRWQSSGSSPPAEIEDQSRGSDIMEASEKGDEASDTRPMRRRWDSEMESVDSKQTDEAIRPKVDASLVPVSAVVDGCVIQPILSQHKCISTAFTVMFCEELEFISTVQHLKSFYFSDSADWMATLVQKLFQEVADVSPLTSRLLHSIYDASVQESVYSDLPSSSHVSLSLRLTRTPDMDDGLNDISSLQFINQLSLNAEIAWPLSVVIGSPCLEEYNTVFRVLLKIRQTRWWLDQIWSQFNETKRFEIAETETRNKMKLARVWYQDALSLVTMLQNYTHHELNQSHWEVFRQKLVQPGLSLTKIIDAHQQYLDVALETCFQRPNTRRLRSMMEAALQSIINFCCVLKEPPRDPDRHQPALASLVNDCGVWTQLQLLSTELKNRSTAFYKTLKYRANRGECTEGLFILMSFNSYYGSLMSE